VQLGPVLDDLELTRFAMPAILLVCLLELVECSQDHALMEKVESLLEGLLCLLVSWAFVLLLLGQSMAPAGI
jgi:hypothetical protein